MRVFLAAAMLCAFACVGVLAQHSPEHMQGHEVHCYARHGHIRRSLHYSGNACDFAQRGWNKTVTPMYDIGDLAEKWNLRDGCTFRRRKDCGHVDVGGRVNRAVAKGEP